MPRLYWPTVSGGIYQRYEDNFIWQSSHHGSHPEWNGKWFYGGVVPGLRSHGGLDITALSGTTVYASHAGMVSRLKEDDGFLTLERRSADGWNGYQTYYGHCQSFLVPLGAEVAAGTPIAVSDNTGPYTTGPHLHFSYAEIAPDQNGLWSRTNLNNGNSGFLDPEPLLCPYGVLVKAQGTSQVYQVSQGTKRLVVDKLALLSIGASGYEPVYELTSAQLEALPNGNPVNYTYQPLTLSAEQAKDMLRTFTEAPNEAQALYARYF